MNVLLHQYIPKRWDVYRAEFYTIAACLIVHVSTIIIVYTKTYPRVTIPTMVFVVGNKTKANIHSWEWDIKTFLVAIGLQGRARDQRFPCYSSCGCVSVLSICDQQG